MRSFLQNRTVRLTGLIVLILLTVAAVIFVFLLSINEQTSSLSGSADFNVPTVDGYVAERRISPPSLPLPPPTYTSNLEAFETTRYSVRAQTKDLADLCQTLQTLKKDANIHFKQLNESTNNCSAHFYVDETKAPVVLSTFTTFHAVSYTRTTESVTRHRNYIQSQTAILQQQLASTERSLIAAETQFNEIAEFARETKDAATLSQTINQKINNIDMLTQRKINLTSQLDQLYQQAAELEERIGLVEFSADFRRLHPININENTRAWEEAWSTLKQQFTDTKIAFTVGFGIFFLWVIRIIFYLTITVLLLKGLWKAGSFIWKK